MTERDQAVQLAQEEVIARRWGVTQQVLAVHEIRLSDGGAPVIARIDEDTEPRAYFIYFPILDEAYYLVVVIRRGELEGLAVSAIYIEAGVRVYLQISSAALSPAEITAHVSLAPSVTHIMGDPITKRMPVRTYRAHQWCFEPQAGMPGAVEEKLSAVLDAVEPAASRITCLKPVGEVTIHVVYKGWGGDPQFGGFHVDLHSVQRLAALGAAFDVDLYASGPAMLEDDETH